MTAAAIAITGIQKSFKGKMAVDVSHLELKPGRTLALLGPSGSGKSTLLSMIGLLEKPDAGTVELDGAPVTVADRAARMTMAAAFQRTYLFKGTVGENVAYGLKLRRISSAETGGRVAAALERVGLPGWQERSALTLSGGEAQRVALARALVLKPSILLLDEPLASLDPIMKWRLTRDFAQILNEERVTTLYVTHDQDEALAVADDVAIMRDGRVVAYGPVDEVFGLPVDDWTAGFLGMEPAVRGRVLESEEGVARIDCGGVDLYAVASLAVGSEVSLGVRPEDVLLFEADAVVPLSSARNKLEAVVAEIDPSGATFRVVVERGPVRIAARISRAALADLRLSVGTPVQVLFKATAVRVAST
ncbi:MAG: ABC transporter ATP-binding protein [Actinobacteria bacterium HGW-Actinobacteria-1]|jgi:molybdopterin-binding protein|nr:MAG: ABC transporter ATP-binding protein [Actinobacteria bacterium HGW-Actinobacteria-1]